MSDKPNWVRQLPFLNSTQVKDIDKLYRKRRQSLLSVDEMVHYSRPSIDVLFESAADAYGSSLIGVILTGANDDGAAGAKRIKSRGGLVVAQDPKTAEAPMMPQAAIDTGAVDQILPLDQIGPFLVERCQLVTHT